MRSRLLHRPLVAALLLTVPACGTDSDPAGPGSDPPGYTNAHDAALAWAAFLTMKDAVRLERLLEPESAGRAGAGFRYYVQPQDVGEFPGIDGEWWGRAEELDMLGNLLDSTFVSPENGQSVKSIHTDLDVLSSTVSDGGTRLVTHVTATVNWGPNSGAVADVRLEMLLVRNADGYFVVREMRELPLPETPGSSRAFAVGPATWGRIKALYRSPSEPGTYRTAEGAVLAWARALGDRDLAAIEKLLEPDPPGRAEPGFRFYPQAQDVDDFPWMTGDSWSRAEELAILANMMDPTFVSQVTGNSVDSMDADLAIDSVEEQADGTRVQARSTFMVLWAPSSGAVADVRLDLLLVRNAAGHMVLRSMRERPLLREPAPSVVPASWGHIKALHR